MSNLLFVTEKTYTIVRIVSESDDYAVITLMFAFEQINLTIKERTFRMSYTEAKELAQMLIEVAEEGIAFVEPTE